MGQKRADIAIILRESTIIVEISGSSQHRVYLSHLDDFFPTLSQPCEHVGTEEIEHRYENCNVAGVRLTQFF